jgi:hypothetical protein
LRQASSIYIEDGRIAEIPSSRSDADTIIDARELISAPGLIDTHVHPTFGDFTPSLLQPQLHLYQGHDLKAMQDDRIDGFLRSSSQYTCSRHDIGQRQGGVGFGELASHLTKAASDLSLVRLEVPD